MGRPRDPVGRADRTRARAGMWGRACREGGGVPRTGNEREPRYCAATQRVTVPVQKTIGCGRDSNVFEKSVAQWFSTRLPFFLPPFFAPKRLATRRAAAGAYPVAALGEGAVTSSW